jgi:hypothetical protein
MECLRVLLANCASWQTWTGSANATAAKTRIHLHDITPPAAAGESYTEAELATLRPLARIDDWMPERGYGDQPWLSRRMGERGPYQKSGKLVLDFEDDVDPVNADNATDAKLAFTNAVGAVIQDLEDLAGVDSYLTAPELAAGVRAIGIQSIEVYQGYVRSDQAADAAQGEHARMQLLIHWGM